MSLWSSQSMEGCFGDWFVESIADPGTVLDLLEVTNIPKFFVELAFTRHFENQINPFTVVEETQPDTNRSGMTWRSFISFHSIETQNSTLLVSFRMLRSAGVEGGGRLIRVTVANRPTILHYIVPASFPTVPPLHLCNTIQIISQEFVTQFQVCFKLCCSSCLNGEGTFIPPPTGMPYGKVY